MTEAKLRQAVAFGQWGVSFLVVLALLAVLLGLPVDETVSKVGGWIVATAGAFFLVLGMALCFRLPDGRKWIALVVEVFVLACGTLYLHHQVELSRASTADARKAAVAQGAEYLALKAQMDSAVSSLAVNSARTFPADYLTAFRENEAAKASDTAKIQTLAQQMKALEDRAPAGEVSAASAFDVFGPSSAWWVEAVVLLVLAIGNEAVALALMYKPKTTAPQTDYRTASMVRTAPQEDHRTAPQSAEPHRTAEAPQSAEHRTALTREDAEEYLAALRSLRAEGKATGYRTIQDRLAQMGYPGWSEAKVREMGRRLREKAEAQA